MYKLLLLLLLTACAFTVPEETTQEDVAPVPDEKIVVNETAHNTTETIAQESLETPQDVFGIPEHAQERYDLLAQDENVIAGILQCDDIIVVTKKVIASGSVVDNLYRSDGQYLGLKAHSPEHVNFYRDWLTCEVIQGESTLERPWTLRDAVESLTSSQRNDSIDLTKVEITLERKYDYRQNTYFIVNVDNPYPTSIPVTRSDTCQSDTLTGGGIGGSTPPLPAGLSTHELVCPGIYNIEGTIKFTSPLFAGTAEQTFAYP